MAIAAANFISDSHTPTVRAFFVVSTWFLVPGLISVILVGGYSLRTTLYLIGAYLLVFLSANAISTFHPESINTFGEVIIGWAAFNIFPVLLAVFTQSKRIRGIAPLILTLGCIAVLGINAWVAISEYVGFSSTTVIGVVTLVSFLITFGLGRRAIGALATAYSKNVFSDQRLSINLVFLIFTAFYVTPGDRGLFLWILNVSVVFLAYLLVSKGLLRKWAQPDSSSVPRLLILRVFSLGSRSRSLYWNVAKLWRRVGTTSLLSGPDLIEATVEPNEFLYFLSRRWKRVLSQTREVGFLALESDNKKPDPDGFYRVDEYFCKHDNWQQTMVDLAKKSDVVLMDVRGLTASNLGSLFELQQLMNFVALDRIILLAEHHTSGNFLEHTLQQLWERTRPGSVNQREIYPEISVFSPRGDVRDHIPELVGLLEARPRIRMQKTPY